MDPKLFEIEKLSVSFNTPEGVLRAVDDVSFDIAAGETVGLVGESGCGKTVTVLSVLGLLSTTSACIESEKVLFQGRNLHGLDPESLRKIRGSEISIIFQEPMTSLNPTLTIGRQVAEPLMIHKGFSRAKAYKEAALWLDRVKIPAAKDHMHDYPYQLSGGMRQRVMIAMAMICNPRLLIADEPTTALDVTIQAQILSLMIQLKEEFGMSLLLITHDLGVIAQMAARVIVMYAGQVVETASIADIFARPFHPYTQGLLKARPRLGDFINGLTDKLHEIKGMVPSLTEAFTGCRFADRCPHAFTKCLEHNPGLVTIQDDQRARCWLTEFPERRQNHS